MLQDNLKEQTEIFPQEEPLAMETSGEYALEVKLSYSFYIKLLLNFFMIPPSCLIFNAFVTASAFNVTRMLLHMNL